MVLYKYKRWLIFQAEHQLTTDPLRIDVTVIKMKPGTVIDKLIGCRFERVNLIEYKSPKQSLSKYHILRMLAYLYLYLSLNGDVDITDITVSFVVSRHPRAVFKYLKDELRWTVTEEGSGIWWVSGGLVPIQIIESKLLPAAEYLWLKHLNEKVKEEHINQILNASKKFTDGALLSAFMHVFLTANKKEMEKIDMSNRDLDSLFEKWGFAARWEEQGEARGKKEAERDKLEVARKLIAKGWQASEVAETVGLAITKVKRLYRNS
jgi:hypothetical protein